MITQFNSSNIVKKTRAELKNPMKNFRTASSLQERLGLSPSNLTKKTKPLGNKPMAHRILCSSIRGLGANRKRAPLVNPEPNQTKKGKAQDQRAEEQAAGEQKLST